MATEDLTKNKLFWGILLGILLLPRNPNFDNLFLKIMISDTGFSTPITLHFCSIFQDCHQRAHPPSLLFRHHLHHPGQLPGHDQGGE